LSAINAERNKKAKELGAYLALRTKGVSDKTLVGIHNLLENASIDYLWGSIKELADLKDERLKRIE
jgi:hypothetical protein